MAEFTERFSLDLTNTLTGNIEFLTYFLQRSRSSVIHTKAESEYLLLSVGQCIKNLIQLFLQKRLCCCFRRHRNIVVLNKITKMAVFLLADRSLQGNRLLRDLQHLTHTFNRHVQFFRNLFRRGFPSQLLQ